MKVMAQSGTGDYPVLIPHRSLKQAPLCLTCLVGDCAHVKVALEYHQAKAGRS